VFSQHKNIMISQKNEPEETAICINTKKPNIMIAAANTENYYFSSDTGKTWRDGSLHSSYGVWGDPCLLIDSLEHFYYFHLSKMPNGNAYDRLVCQKSRDKGVTWSNGTILGLNGEQSQDKEWAAIDPKSNYIYVLWTEQKKKNMHDQPRTTTDINLSISKDLGKTWSKGIKINEKPGSDFDNWKTVIGAMPAIGPNSQVYSTWVGYNAIYFDKSLDSGKTWISKDKIVAPLNDQWSMNIPGVYRCYIFPVIACDNSNGPHKGSIYIIWSDKKKGGGDANILFSVSSDDGATWSNPVKVNNDSTARHQYQPWMTIDQTNGYIYIVFYDRRNYKDARTDVYMARSIDGGHTFTNFKVNERPFTPKSGTFMGDYLGLVAYNNIVRPVWTALDDHQKLSVWTAIINTNDIK
jgi:hypothetical protein